MEKRLFYRIILFSAICIPLFFAAASKAASRVHHAAYLLSKSITAKPDTSLVAHKPYQKHLADLSSQFRKKGLPIDSLLQDPRFEIYGNLDKRFHRAAEKKAPSLKQYKRIIGFEAKKNNIRTFIHSHSGLLQEAEKKYGISQYVIAAILGIESDFGKVTGRYNPFNTYVSMYALQYRGDFARAQLKELLEFSRRKNLDIFELRSSYAGAMAFAQFIPYSLNKWFVGDDLSSMDDNIMSVANYLSYFKKRTGSIKEAVMRYNPSSLYTNAVLDLSKAAEKEMQAEH